MSRACSLGCTCAFFEWMRQQLFPRLLPIRCRNEKCAMFPFCQWTRSPDRTRNNLDTVQEHFHKFNAHSTSGQSIKPSCADLLTAGRQV